MISNRANNRYFSFDAKIHAELAELEVHMSVVLPALMRHQIRVTALILCCGSVGRRKVKPLIQEMSRQVRLLIGRMLLTCLNVLGNRR